MLNGSEQLFKKHRSTINQKKATLKWMKTNSHLMTFAIFWILLLMKLKSLLQVNKKNFNFLRSLMMERMKITW